MQRTIFFSLASLNREKSTGFNHFSLHLYVLPSLYLDLNQVHIAYQLFSLSIDPLSDFLLGVEAVEWQHVTSHQAATAR
jgi:hypothetical protein